MNMTDFLHLPFVEVLKLLVKGSVEEYLAEKEATSSNTNQIAAQPDCESLDMKGALELLNANGYPIKRGSSTRKRAREQCRSRNSGASCISRNRSCLNGLNHGS